MTTEIPLDENVLARYLEGLATENDQSQIDVWLNQKSENILELDQYRKLWELRNQQNSSFEPDAEMAWQKVSKRINVDTQQLINIKKPIWRSLQLAASILLVGGLSIYFFIIKPNNPPFQSLVSENNTIDKILSDSSKVFLNYNSKLEYPDQFAWKERRVKLKGEAFFEIKPNPSKPFIIEANDLNIKVLGTSFNVKTDSVTVIVSVRTGKVRVAKSDSEYVILHAGQEVAYDKNAFTFNRNIKADANEFAYFSKVYSFKNTPLSEIAKTLSKGYHKNIKISSTDLQDLSLTTKFENESLENALQIIAETLQLEVKIENNAYVFSKKIKL